MKKKIKFNILDFSIILLAVIAILAVVFWNDIRDEFVYEKIEKEYTFKIKGVSEKSLLSMSSTMEFFIEEDELSAGIVKEIRSEKEIMTAVLSDGSTKNYVGDTYIVEGKAIVTGREKENGFYISGEHFVVPGKKFTVHTESVSLEIEIVDIYDA